MQTPTTMLPMDASLPAAPAKPAANKDGGKSSKKSSDSFGSVLSTKVNQDKPDESAKATSAGQKDQTADNAQGANTVQPLVPGGIIPVIPVPVTMIIESAGTSDAGTIDGVSALAAATTTAQTSQTSGQANTATLTEVLQKAGDAVAQADGTEAAPGKPAFLAIFNMAAKDQGTSKTAGTNVTLQTMNGTVVPQQPTTTVPTAAALAVTGADTPVDTLQAGQADSEQMPSQLVSATVTEAQKLMTVTGEKKQPKSTEAATQTTTAAAMDTNGKEQTVPAVSALTNGAADQKKDGQGAEQSLKAGMTHEVEADMPEKAKATDTPSFAAVLDSQTVHTKSVADSAATTAGAPVKPDTNNVFGQIVDQAKLISRGNNSEMVIKLNPEHLGELTLKVAIEGGTVSASFHSSNSDVRAVIESTLPQLKQELSNQGLKVDYVGVYASLDQFSPRDHQSNAQQQTIKLKRRGSEQFEEAIEATGTVVQPSSETGVDYRV